MEIHPFSLVIPHTIGFFTTENENLTRESGDFS
jgi:hypothetical protein